MKTLNSAGKAKKALGQKPQSVPKKTKASSKTAASVAKMPPEAKPIGKKTAQKVSGKKTIRLNPLARTGDSWNSPASVQGSISELPTQKTPKIKQIGRSSGIKSKKTRPRSSAEEALLEKQSNVKDDFDCGSIDYFVLNHWENVKISNNNNELGVFDRSGNFYPLSSFQIQKNSRNGNRFAQLGVPGAVIGGALGLVAAGFMSLRRAALFGYLYSNNSNTEIYIKFDKKGIKAMEMARIVVK